MSRVRQVRHNCDCRTCYSHDNCRVRQVRQVRQDGVLSRPATGATTVVRQGGVYILPLSHHRRLSRYGSRRDGECDRMPVAVTMSRGGRFCTRVHMLETV